MNIEIYRSNKFLQNKLIEDWAEIFEDPKNILLVESQEELDFFWAMQLVFGNEIDIRMYDPNISLPTYRMSTTGYLFLTWDPWDRNII